MSDKDTISLKLKEEDDNKEDEEDICEASE